MRYASTKESIAKFMSELGRKVPGTGRIYFTGGVTAVLMGWREMTLDIDLRADPEPSGFFGSLSSVKEGLEINVELASPADFIPTLPGWQERSLYIDRQGKIDFYHYDLYSQALAKIERFHARDQIDVSKMMEQSYVKPIRLREHFEAIKPQLERFPGIRADLFERQVHRLTSSLEV